jgi:hypothetical protein
MTMLPACVVGYCSGDFDVSLPGNKQHFKAGTELSLYLQECSIWGRPVGVVAIWSLLISLQPLSLLLWILWIFILQAAQAQAAAIMQDIDQQLQEQEDQMRQALMRLGLTQVAAQEFIVNGIRTLSQLRTLTEDALDRLVKQIHRDNTGVGAGLFIPFASQQYIHAVRFWANRMHILGLPYTVDFVTLPLAETWNEIRKSEKEAEKVPTDLVKAPESYKKDTKWRTWKENVENYLHSKIGQAGIPLAYIIREHNRPIPGLMYATSHDQLVDMAILNGGIQY